MLKKNPSFAAPCSWSVTELAACQNLLLLLPLLCVLPLFLVINLWYLLGCGGMLAKDTICAEMPFMLIESNRPSNKLKLNKS